MRLINVASLQVEEFFGLQIPAYAILSHCWGADEATYQEWTAQRHVPESQRNAGHRKILAACRQANADEMQYLWCDTVCIDKQSSAELSEAINSMWAWYRDSDICYVHLFDVPNVPDAATSKHRKDLRARESEGLQGSALDSFKNSRWFTRGWTLQELIAPKHLRFYSKDWEELGAKLDLITPISEVTGIPSQVLQDRSRVFKATVAQRMSWVSDRQTTRPEDMSYCLLGLFDINMPLLYGEGRKAFQRLQHEIVQKTNDQSILAWTPTKINASLHLPILAPSPACFRWCDEVELDDKVDRRSSMLSISNTGLSLDGGLIATAIGGLWLIQLQCVIPTKVEFPANPVMDLICIAVQALEGNESNTFVRIAFPTPSAFFRLPYRLKYNWDNSFKRMGWQLFVRNRSMSRITLIPGNEVSRTPMPKMFPLWQPGRGESFLPIIGPGLRPFREDLSRCNCGLSTALLRPRGWHRLCKHRCKMGLIRGRSKYELVFMYPVRDMRPPRAHPGTQVLPLMTFVFSEQVGDQSHGLLVFRHTRGFSHRLIGLLISVTRGYYGQAVHIDVHCVEGLSPTDLPEDEDGKKSLVEALARQYKPPDHTGNTSASSSQRTSRLSLSLTKVNVHSYDAKPHSNSRLKEIFTEEMPILLSARANASTGSNALPRLCSADFYVQRGVRHGLIPLMIDSHDDVEHDIPFGHTRFSRNEIMTAIFTVIISVSIFSGLAFWFRNLVAR